MKITLKQENFNHALAVTSRVASSRTDLPILANILLRTENGRLLIAATNLEAAVSETIGARIVEPGEITVPARLIADFVANLPHTDIEISTDGTKVELKAGGFSSVINAASAEDFPALPSVAGDNKFTIAAEDLRDAIAGTAFVASADTTRPILTGVYIYSLDKKLYFAATDGYRLAEKKSISVDQEISLLVPATTLMDLSRILTDGQKIEVRFDGEQVSFIAENIVLTSRLVDGNFIDYRKLIPKDTDFSAEVDRAELQKITKVAALFAKNAAGSVVIKLDEKAGELAMQSLASEIGENSSVLEADVKGDGSISLNSKFLMDSLSAISGERVKLQFSGKLAPVLLTGASDDYKHIIMPVKS